MAATQPSPLVVPTTVRAAMLIGNGPQSYGVIAVGANGAIITLPLAPGFAERLANIAVSLRTDPKQDAVAFVTGLPARLTWMVWAKPVKPGETITVSIPQPIDVNKHTTTEYLAWLHAASERAKHDEETLRKIREGDKPE